MDPISDLFIRIKNAAKARHETVQLPYSKFKHEIVRALERQHWIEGVEKKGKRIRKTLEMKLIYKEEQPIISDVKLISRPSRRLYASYKDLPRSRHGGLLLLSTSRGVMSSEEARKAKVGGELIAEIW